MLLQVIVVMKIVQQQKNINKRKIIYVLIVKRK